MRRREEVVPVRIVLVTHCRERSGGQNTEDQAMKVLYKDGDFKNQSDIFIYSHLNPEL